MPQGRRYEIVTKILSNVAVDPATGCWIWQGSHSGDGKGGGYPRMSLDGQTVAVHRVMYVCVHGYVPGKKQLDHTCVNRACVNPGHLEIVTNRRNNILRIKREKERVKERRGATVERRDLERARTEVT